MFSDALPLSSPIDLAVWETSVQLLFVLYFLKAAGIEGIDTEFMEHFILLS